MYVDIARKLLSALTEEEWRACEIPLRNTSNQYCGLGILCELHRRETGNEWELVEGTNKYSYLDSQYLLPEAVRQWSGLLSKSGDSKLAGYTFCVISLSGMDNDFTALREFLVMALKELDNHEIR